MLLQLCVGSFPVFKTILSQGDRCTIIKDSRSSRLSRSWLRRGKLKLSEVLGSLPNSCKSVPEQPAHTPLYLNFKIRAFSYISSTFVPILYLHYLWLLSIPLATFGAVCFSPFFLSQVDLFPSLITPSPGCTDCSFQEELLCCNFLHTQTYFPLQPPQPSWSANSSLSSPPTPTPPRLLHTSQPPERQTKEDPKILLLLLLLI